MTLRLESNLRRAAAKLLLSAVILLSAGPRLRAQAPAIATQPLLQTVAVGQAVTFTVLATGAPAPTYQWRKNGGNISGATNAAYAVANAQARDAGGYDVVIANGAGSVTSALAPLTVIGTTGRQFVTVGEAGAILTSPDGQTWTSRASGSAWRLRGVANTADLFVVVGESGSILTSPDGVTWTARASGVTETLRGVATNFTRFVAVGGQTASLVRYSDDGIVWSAATTPALGKLRAVAWGNGQFLAVGAGGATVLTSPDGVIWTSRNLMAPEWSMTMTGTLLAALQLRLNSERFDGVVWTGSQFQIISAAGNMYSSADGIAWTWLSPASPPAWVESLAWSDTRYMVVGAGGTVAISPSGAYWSTLSTGVPGILHGVAWSGPKLAPAADPIALVDNLRQAPGVATQPLSQSILAGQNATLTVAATGTGALTYQWYQGSTGVTATPIGGATAASYTTPVLTATTSYWVRVSGPGGMADSATATVTIATYAPMVALSVEGPAQYITSGGTVALRVGVTYTGQTPSAIGATVNLPAGWSLASTGGPNIPQVAPLAGTTNVLEWGYTGFPANELSFTFVVNTPAGQSGSKILGGFVNYRPDNVNVTLPSRILVAVTPLVITTQPRAVQVELGQPATLSVVATGDPAPTYQWRKEGVAVPGATNATLYIAAVALSHGGYYDVVVANGVAAPVTSSQVLLGVVPAGSLATHLVIGGGYSGLSKVTISNTITYPGTATALGWQVLLPAGWSFDTDGGAAGEQKPPANATGLLEWAWMTIPPSPVTFSYTVNKPAGAAGDITLVAVAIVRLQDLAWGLNLLARPDPLVLKPVVHHTADVDRNFRINLTELTRVIELYNTRYSTNRTGRYRVEAGTEDGFAPDPPASSNQVLSVYHAADSDRNGRLDLFELTRVIELYNYRSGTVRTGQYRAVPPPAVTEDGYAPGL